MKTKDINKLSDMAYYYPYMGIFTNNPNDIRSLEFLFHFNSNNLSKLTSNNSLKFEYFKMFRDAYNHLNILENILLDDNLTNYSLKKWFYDFIFVPMIDEFDSFFKWPANIPSKETYENLLEDNYFDISNLDIFDVDQKDSSLSEIFNLITEFRNKLDTYKQNFNTYINENNQEIPIPTFPNININKLDSSNITKFIDYSDETFKTITNINNLLNSKYLRFVELKQEILNKRVPQSKDNLYCHNSILNIDIDKCNDIIDVITKEENYGPISKKFFHNKEYFKIFDNLQMSAIQENINFIMDLFLKKLGLKKKLYAVDFFEPIKKIIIYESNLNIQVEQGFFIIEHDVFEDYDKNDIFYIILNDENNTLNVDKLILSEKITKKKAKFLTGTDYKPINLSQQIMIMDNTNFINPGKVELYFYETVDSWKKYQNTDKSLNENENLMEYLNILIHTINKNLYFLNPQFNFLNEKSYQIIDGNKDNINLAIKNYFKLIYKSIKNLSITKAWKLDIKVIYEKLINLSLGLKYDRIKENYEPSNLYNLINLPNYEKNMVIFNLTNSIGILNSYNDNPSNKNLELLTSILNMSNQFYKNI